MPIPFPTHLISEGLGGLSSHLVIQCNVICPVLVIMDCNVARLIKGNSEWTLGW